MNKHSILYILWLFVVVFMISSCKKYLDQSPDKSLTTPAVAQDLRALLDNNKLMNEYYPVFGAIASDNYSVTDEVYNALSSSPSACVGYYTWGLIDEPTDWQQDWAINYKRIFSVNVVLDYVDKVEINGMTHKDLKAIKGEALFYRGYTHFLYSQTYAMPYNPATANDLPGAPLRLTSDITQKAERPNLKDEFTRVISDLRHAATLLPNIGRTKLRPSRPAAYAALANVYLVMQEYNNARNAADSALAINDSLMDYNKIDTNQLAPFPVFNKEVIWQADLAYNSMLAPMNSNVRKSFYESFEENDLRKILYFDTTGGDIKFKGQYNGQSQATAVYFGGLAVDELYLIIAEVAAREGNLSEAASTLNILAKKRFKMDTFRPFSFSNQQDAIMAILDMRRKELCFRGIYRWIDIKRLSQIAGEEITPQRTLLGKTYTLEPGDLHYAFLLPQEVISESGMQQNPR